MAKKPMSEEARKAASDRMKKMHADKKAREAVEQGDATHIPYEANAPVQEKIITQDDYNELVRQIEELKANSNLADLLKQAIGNNGPQVTEQGMVGRIEKFVVDPGAYPDPREELADEPKLQRFAFKHNWELGWEVAISSYTTIDNIKMKEPKFIVELIRIVLDEQTGEPTNQRYVACRGIFHEDPETALTIAKEQNLEVDESNQKLFMDRMRYIRIRDWLFEAFVPPVPAQNKTNKREVVIGNKLVEVYTVNSETTESIPFNELKKAKL